MKNLWKYKDKDRFGAEDPFEAWPEWEDLLNHDGLPEVDAMDLSLLEPSELPPELIGGVLRRGHKMLVSGSSKAGKSFLMMELAVAVTEGLDWLGFSCMKGKVLYVNLEIDAASCIERIRSIYKAKGIEPKYAENLLLWNLRGFARPIDELLPHLYLRMWDEDIDAVIIDPIYKVITGDENSATDMAAFCNHFDRICQDTGASVICCHHHSKGAQGYKRAMDRASGSGVFARDPDAQLDLIRLELPKDIDGTTGNSTAWRLDGILREFPPFEPVNIWFDYPIHKVDTEGLLADAVAEGSAGSNLLKSSKRTCQKERKGRLDKSYQAMSNGKPVKISELAAHMGVTQQTIRNYIKDRENEYWCENGLVGRREKPAEEAKGT